MMQAIELRAAQRPQQSATRLRIGGILLCTIVALQAMASVALAGSIWP